MTDFSTTNLKYAHIVQTFCMSCIVALGLLLSPSAQAQELDGAALQKLAQQGTWGD